MLPKILREKKYSAKNWLSDLTLAVHVSKVKKRGLKDFGL